jgi:hypothetical protein
MTSIGPPCLPAACESMQKQRCWMCRKKAGRPEHKQRSSEPARQDRMDIAQWLWSLTDTYMYASGPGRIRRALQRTRCPERHVKKPSDLEQNERVEPRRNLSETRLMN